MQCHGADGGVVSVKELLCLSRGRTLLVQIGAETVSVSDHVRVLGVTFLSDVSLDKHVASVCSSGFHRLRQLRRVRRSPD